MLAGRRSDVIADAGRGAVCAIGGAATSAGEIDFGIVVIADETVFPALDGTADAPIVRPPHDSSSNIAISSEREPNRAVIFCTPKLSANPKRNIRRWRGAFH